MKELLVNGGDQVINERFHGSAPIAIVQDDRAMVLLLANHGTDLDVKNCIGETPVDLLRSRGDEDLAKELERIHRERAKDTILQSTILDPDSAGVVAGYL